jgi:hypothetical protein
MPYCDANVLLTQSGHGGALSQPLPECTQVDTIPRLGLGATNEAARLHQDDRQRGSDVAGCGARTAT